jgi:hypothetical protein
LDSNAKISGLAQQVCEALPNALVVKPDVAETIEITANAELTNQSPRDLFDRFVREQKNTVPSQEMLAKFDELYKEAKYATD